MGLFTNFSKDVRSRAANQFSGWVVPKGSHALRVNNLVSAYTLGVFLVAMLLLGSVSGKGMSALLVLIAAVMSVSQVAKSHVIPALYTSLAPRFAWPSWTDGWAQDEVELARGGAPTQGTPAPQATPAAPAAVSAVATEVVAEVEKPQAGALPPDHLKVLQAWASLDPARRTARALEVVNFLKSAPGASELLEIDESFSEDIQKALATKVLQLLAKTEKVQLASE